MTNILIGGSMNPGNKGDQARIKALVTELARDEECRISLLSHSPDGDRDTYAGDPLLIIRAPWANSRIKLGPMAAVAVWTLFLYSFHFLARKVFRIKLKNRWQRFNAFILTSGIDFSDYVGRWPMYYGFFLITLFGIFMGKPVICLAQSIGPVQHRFLRRLTGFFLQRTAVIALREASGLPFLRESGVKKPRITVTSDLAFLLQPQNRPLDYRSSLIMKNMQRPIIGVNPSAKPFAGPGTGYCSMGFWFRVNEENARQLTRDYYENMARLADSLIDRYNATLLFVPNCTARGDDDRESMREVLRLMEHKNRVYCITWDLNLSETMVILNECDMLIGTRLHANLLACIQGVPVVPLVATESPRVPGIMGMLGLDKYVCKLDGNDFTRLQSTIDEVWSNQEEISACIIERVGLSRTKALENISLVRRYSGNVPGYGRNKTGEPVEGTTGKTDIQQGGSSALL